MAIEARYIMLAWIIVILIFPVLVLAELMKYDR